jgi:hypothetical protein
MSKHLIKELDREVDSLRSALGVQVGIHNRVIDWLESEIEHNESISTLLRLTTGDEVLTDGTQDIHAGRYECATSLLRQIEKWEVEK